MITTRKAELQDAVLISEIQRLSWYDTYQGIIDEAFLKRFRETDRTEQWKKEMAGGDNNILILCYGNRPVGFASWGAMREADLPYQYELYAFYVLKDYRGLGLGTVAVEVIKNEIDSLPLFVWVLEGNPSMSFYHKRGKQLDYSREITIAGRPYAEVAFEL